MQLTGQVDDSAPSISNSRSYVCVAFDGWRLKYRFRDHAHGFLFSDWEGKSVFHSLIGDSESHDDVYIRELVSSQIAEIERQYGVIVSSVVTDNAKAMTNAVDSLPEYLDRPLIIQRCSAHWLQLVLQDVQKGSSSMQCHSANIQIF